jgi:hypothetical protein
MVREIDRISKGNFANGVNMIQSASQVVDGIVNEIGVKTLELLSAAMQLLKFCGGNLRSVPKRWIRCVLRQLRRVVHEIISGDLNDHLLLIPVELNAIRHLPFNYACISATILKRTNVTRCGRAPLSRHPQPMGDGRGGSRLECSFDLILRTFISSKK